jgi:hypothetical protein
VSYLSAKEALITAGTTPVVSGGEQDMLAVYLHTGRSFSTGATLVSAGFIARHVTRAPGRDSSIRRRAEAPVFTKSECSLYVLRTHEESAHD